MKEQQRSASAGAASAARGTDGLALRLSSGRGALLLALQRERARLWTPEPWAVGQPVCFEVLLPDGGLPVRLRGRCMGARRLAPDRYEATVRLVDLRRADRERILAALPARR